MANYPKTELLFTDTGNLELLKNLYKSKILHFQIASVTTSPQKVICMMIYRGIQNTLISQTIQRITQTMMQVTLSYLVSSRMKWVANSLMSSVGLDPKCTPF